MSDSDFGDEESRLSGRVRRYARVGGRVGGLAARMVGARVFGLGLDRARRLWPHLNQPGMKQRQLYRQSMDRLPASALM